MRPQPPWQSMSSTTQVPRPWLCPPGDSPVASLQHSSCAACMAPKATRRSGSVAVQSRQQPQRVDDNGRRSGLKGREVVGAEYQQGPAQPGGHGGGGCWCLQVSAGLVPCRPGAGGGALAEQRLRRRRSHAQPSCRSAGSGFYRSACEHRPSPEAVTRTARGQLRRAHARRQNPQPHWGHMSTWRVQPSQVGLGRLRWMRPWHPALHCHCPSRSRLHELQPAQRAPAVRPRPTSPTDCHVSQQLPPPLSVPIPCIRQQRHTNQHKISPNASQTVPYKRARRMRKIPTQVTSPRPIPACR